MSKFYIRIIENGQSIAFWRGRGTLTCACFHEFTWVCVQPRGQSEDSHSLFSIFLFQTQFASVPGACSFNKTSYSRSFQDFFFIRGLQVHGFPCQYWGSELTSSCLHSRHRPAIPPQVFLSNVLRTMLQTLSGNTIQDYLCNLTLILCF